LTWGLLFVWLLLMSFAVVSLANPAWLQELGRRGREAEAANYKHYGDDALREGKYLLAIPQYERSLRIDPEQPSVRLNLAIACIRLGKAYWPRAEQLLSESLEMDPHATLQGVIWVNFGELREKQGRRDEALAYYQQALQAAVEKDRVYRRLATLYVADGQYEKAREAFSRMLDLRVDPTRPYRKMLEDSVDRLRRDEEHLAVIEDLRARDVTPADLAPYDLEIIRQMQQSDPEVAKLHNDLGALCARLGDFAAAEEHFRRSLEISPDNPDARKNLKALQLRQQQP
jgi:tetratricopeptide (TPR) repeat protein